MMSVKKHRDDKRRPQSGSNTVRSYAECADHSTQRTKVRAARLIMPVFPFSYNRGGLTIGFAGNALKFFRAALSYALNAAPRVSDSGSPGDGLPVPP